VNAVVLAAVCDLKEHERRLAAAKRASDAADGSVLPAPCVSGVYVSRRVPPRCALCFEVVDRDGPRVLKLDIVEPRCAVTLRWCLACAGVDPLNEALAEAEAAGEVIGAERDPLQDAYHAILDRTAARDAAFLPAVADVRRDIDEVRQDGSRVTMRAPGDRWGRPTEVTARGMWRWPR
jgi:hypothetical protein